MLEGDVNVGEVIKMCPFHDLGEARTSDLNYVHQKYANADEKKAIGDLAKTVEFGTDIQKTVKDFNEGKTKEAMLAKDADQIEFILSLREQSDIGNSRADTWIPSAVKRLKTKSAQDLTEAILKTPSDDWWFGDKSDRWWVTRNKDI